jgi:hypothetical protein
MKILVDNGVISGSDFLVGDSREQELKWGDLSARSAIAGFRRVDVDRDADQQREKDALFTIGRIAREGRVTLHTYSELMIEDWRGSRGRNPFVNAFEKCKFHQCQAAIERSKFRQTINMDEWLTKGGRRDREKGIAFSEFSQNAFFQWLTSLSFRDVTLLLSHANTLKLDDFEIASLRDLSWFQALSRALASSENLPDCFHI